jgi:carboxymethylenebutenolidase
LRTKRGESAQIVTEEFVFQVEANGEIMCGQDVRSHETKVSKGEEQANEDGPMTWACVACLFAGLCALPGLSATLVVGMDSPSSEEIVARDPTFKSRGKEFKVDVFAPGAPGRYPAIVVLHGHGGAGENQRSLSHDLARRLAQTGYVALVPHYFGALKPDPKNGQKNARSYAIWTRTVSDSISFAARQENVDPKRIGLLGSSLGSWVALSVAARDRRVSAVVEYYGGLPEWEELDLGRLPPVLILHGDADRNVRVQEAYKLEQTLSESGVFHEMHIYAGAGHGFRGGDREDSIKRTLDFFDVHVKRTP